MELPDLSVLDLPTGPLAYRRGGSGPPLLLIHGWGGSSRYWMGAYATLAASYDIIAVDLPGCGDSPQPAWRADLPGLTAALAATVDALGLRGVAVGGHSLGAALALMLADARPRLVQRLALVSFGLPRTQQEEAAFAALHLQLTASAAVWGPWLGLWEPWLAPSRPWAQVYWTTPPLPMMLAANAVYNVAEVPYPALALGVADLVGMGARVALEAASSSGDPAVTAVARRVTVPTLVIGGRDDQLFPPSASAALAEALPVSAYILLDRCGHVPMVERSVAFYTTLGSFLAL